MQDLQYLFKHFLRSYSSINSIVMVIRAVKHLVLSNFIWTYINTGPILKVHKKFRRRPGRKWHKKISTLSQKTLKKSKVAKVILIICTPIKHWEFCLQDCCFTYSRVTEAVVWRYSVEKVCLRPGTLLKMRLWHRCFPVNFVKFLRTPFFTEHLRWLLME